MKSSTTRIQETLNWVNKVVIGLNFCPFAAPVVTHDKLHIELVDSSDQVLMMQALIEECTLLDNSDQYETSLIVLPQIEPNDFNTYLDLVTLAEAVLEDSDYEGVYQIATFHPNYIFAGSEENDPANYTNRSPYPMFHIIPEVSLEAAIASYPNVEQIPIDNENLAREKGLAAMALLRQSCFVDASSAESGLKD